MHGLEWRWTKRIVNLVEYLIGVGAILLIRIVSFIPQLNIIWTAKRPSYSTGTTKNAKWPVTYVIFPEK